MHNDTRIAVDLAKSVFEIGLSFQPGKVARRLRVTREKFLSTMAQLPRGLVVMEACGSAHFWAHENQKLGHEVRLLPAQHVKPYVLRDKTDRMDVKGLLEASRNESIRPVPIKSPEQQLLASLHRLRSAWMGDRTARLNTLRGLLRERGVFIPVGAEHVVPHVRAVIGDADSTLPDALRLLLAQACDEVRDLERRIKDCERQLAALAKQMRDAQRLLTIPGIGLITATALVGFVGDVRRFPSARHFASYLGIVPRERSSALVRRLGGISKRGDVYIRTLLIHGARSVLRAAQTQKRPDRLRAWALGRHEHCGYNKAAVALANKLARILWAVWRQPEATFVSVPQGE